MLIIYLIVKLQTFLPHRNWSTFLVIINFQFSNKHKFVLNKDIQSLIESGSNKRCNVEYFKLSPDLGLPAADQRW